ncbi:MAG: retropepsin-like domain-containing protein [Deltaproteobacteria bacterium]|nr:retropepsin-like domain-containing protein [Deltaproteobacteria bacterium]
MRYTFSYKSKKLGPEKSTLRPYAEVQLKIQGRRIPFDFLVDSGADRTVINRPLGCVLGYEVKPGEKPIKLGGIGGTTNGYLRGLRLWIGDTEIETEVIWVQSDTVPLLLGQMDIFDHFDITFSKVNQKVFFDLLK